MIGARRKKWRNAGLSEPTAGRRSQEVPGGLALMLAADHGFSVASVNYGGLTPDSERALPRACPITSSGTWP